MWGNWQQIDCPKCGQYHLVEVKANNNDDRTINLICEECKNKMEVNKKNDNNKIKVVVNYKF